MIDTASSGIFVIEGSPAGAPIELRRDSVAAFIGPTPRGPADIPVAVRSAGEYHRRFGCADAPSRMEGYLRQFFANGGRVAIVVRICRSQHRARIHLPGVDGTTTLEAVCPGSFEYLRASVDYDGIARNDRDTFNLVVQRLASPGRSLVVEQEIYRGVSAEPSSPEFLGDQLLKSRLVRLVGDAVGRPARTLGPGVSAAAYIYADGAGGVGDLPGDYDIIGSSSDGTGLFALEQIPRLDLLCLVPPAAGRPVGPVAHFAAERYCRSRHAMLLVDPPTDWATVHDVVSDRRPLGLDSPNVLTYFPRPRDGSLLGAIAGALVSRDAEQGPWAGDCQGLSLSSSGRMEARLSEVDVSVLARCGVNAAVVDLRGRIELRGLVTGARRAGLSPEWSSLKLRRTALFILGGIDRGSRWILFRPDDDYALAELKQQLLGFLTRLEQVGALSGDRGHSGWYLQGPVFADGELILELGLALRRPGEYVTYRLTQRHGGCEVRELGWRPNLAQAV